MLGDKMAVNNYVAVFTLFALILLTAVSCSTDGSSSEPGEEAPAIVIEKSRDTNETNDFFRILNFTTDTFPTALGRPNAVKVFMGASVFFAPPVPVGKVATFFGIPLNTANDIFVVRCIPGDAESLDPMLATWPNVFEIIQEDLSQSFGFTCPPDEMLEGDELTLNELFCMVDGFEDVGFTDSNGDFVVSTTIENALSLGASLFTDTSISTQLARRYGIFTVFSGLGFAVNGALESVVTNSAEVLQQSVVPEYLVNNATFVDADCSCIHVQAGNWTENDLLDINFVLQNGGFGECFTVNGLGFAN
jgi:hypothetical protein